MIIDGHGHNCGDYLTPHGIISTLDSNGADKVILVPGEYMSSKNYSLPNFARIFPGSEVITLVNFISEFAVALSGSAKQINKGNEKVFEISRHNPERILQFYWVLLKNGLDEKTLQTHYSEWHFKGIKLHQCWDDFFVGSPSFKQLCRFAGENKLPIFIHLKKISEVVTLTEFAGKFPKVNFIVGHLFGLEKVLNARHKCDNIFFDISCPDLISDRRLQKGILSLGAGKFIMGSDTPYGKSNLTRNIHRIRSLNIPESDKEMILGNNMTKLLSQ